MVNSFVLIWRLLRRTTVFIWCDIISCICVYPACEPFRSLRYFTGGRSVTSHLVWLSLNDWSLVYDSRMSCVSLTYALCMTHVWLVHDAGFDLPSFRPRGDFYIHLFVSRWVIFFPALRHMVWLICVDMTTSETQDCLHLMRYIHIVYQCFTCLWTLPLRYISRAVVQSRLTWSDCLSMIESLCMTHVCLVYHSRMHCV